MSSPSPQRAWPLCRSWRYYVPIVLALCACGQVLGLDKYDGAAGPATASSTSSQGGSGAGGAGVGGSGAGGSSVGGSGAGGEAPPCLMGEAQYWDDFNRADIIDGWGTSSSAHVYATDDVSYLAVTNGVGEFPYPNETYHYAEVPDFFDEFVLEATVGWTIPPTGTSFLIAGIQFRAVNSADNYELRFEYHEGDNVTLTMLETSSGGGQTEMGPPLDLGGSFEPEGYRVRMQVRGQGGAELSWLLRVWPADEQEPSMNAQSASGVWSNALGPSTGKIRMHGKRTGPGNLIISFDDVYVCVP